MRGEKRMRTRKMKMTSEGRKKKKQKKRLVKCKRGECVRGGQISQFVKRERAARGKGKKKVGGIEVRGGIRKISKNIGLGHGREHKRDSRRKKKKRN